MSRNPFYPSDEEFESDPFLSDELDEQQREDDGVEDDDCDDYFKGGE